MQSVVYRVYVCGLLEVFVSRSDYMYVQTYVWSSWLVLVLMYAVDYLGVFYCHHLLRESISQECLVTGSIDKLTATPPLLNESH